ncbi:MAG TPA: hypothetical protein VM711_09940, partial [Sphingomicrobium sp.]|nr:hypothetical protein [Sphingomicrobium sp.]
MNGALQEGEEEMARPKAVLHPVPLRATKNVSGQYQFRPDSDLWNDAEEELLFHKNKHGMSKHDYHLIEFTLDDQSGDGLRFPSVPH